MLLVTEWKQFRIPNLNVMKKLMKKQAIFDGRNIYDAADMEASGFDYFCIGIRK
jgi:UDPglucose 6-dehydrogenase